MLIHTAISHKDAEEAAESLEKQVAGSPPSSQEAESAQALETLKHTPETRRAIGLLWKVSSGQHDGLLHAHEG